MDLLTYAILCTAAVGIQLDHDFDFLAAAMDFITLLIDTEVLS